MSGSEARALLLGIGLLLGMGAEAAPVLPHARITIEDFEIGTRAFVAGARGPVLHWQAQSEAMALSIQGLPGGGTGLLSDPGGNWAQPLTRSATPAGLLAIEAQDLATTLRAEAQALGRNQGSLLAPPASFQAAAQLLRTGNFTASSDGFLVLSGSYHMLLAVDDQGPLGCCGLADQARTRLAVTLTKRLDAPNREQLQYSRELSLANSFMVLGSTPEQREQSEDFRLVFALEAGVSYDFLLDLSASIVTPPSVVNVIVPVGTVPLPPGAWLLASALAWTGLRLRRRPVTLSRPRRPGA